jgi:hypothetical protein
VGLSPFDEVQPWTRGTQITDSNAFAGRSLYFTAYGKSRLDLLLVASTDTVDHTLTLYINPNGGDQVYLGSVPIPAGSGFGGLLPVNVLPALGFGGDGLAQSDGQSIEGSLDSQPSAGTFVYVTGWGATLPS